MAGWTVQGEGQEDLTAKASRDQSSSARERFVETQQAAAYMVWWYTAYVPVDGYTEHLHGDLCVFSCVNAVKEKSLTERHLTCSPYQIIAFLN